MSFFFKIKKFLLDNIIFRKYQTEYLSHLANNFDLKKNAKNDQFILYEYYPSWASIIANVYLLLGLKKKHNSKIILYLPIKPSKLKLIFYKFIFNNKLSYFKILNSFCENKLIIPDYKNNNKKKILSKLKQFRNKKDVLEFKYENVYVGDLLYDSYLKEYKTYTLDPFSIEFRNYCLEFCNLLEFWFDLFRKKKIKAVVASHPVYENAIPLRISWYFKNKDSFTSAFMFTYRHSEKKRGFEYDLRKRFKNLTKSEKKKGIILAKKELIKKFKGQNTIDTTYGERIPITQKIRKKDKTISSNNILIAAHSFSDAPHVFGKFVFEDHYEWLKFLAEQSKNSKYKWYIKIHPYFYDDEIVYMRKIFKNYSHVSILSKDTTNQELINTGIKFVLSVYGSVVYEYAYFGIPSILASKNHPYENYNFLKDAGNKNEYKKLISNLDNLKFSYSKKEVYENYYIRYFKINKLLKNYPKVVDKMGSNFQTSLIYKFWLQEFNLKKHKKLISTYQKYIDSNKYSFEFR